LACTSSPSSMLMILRFGVLMELLNSCIFLSQLLSCLTKISSVFFFNFFSAPWDQLGDIPPAPLWRVGLSPHPALSLCCFTCICSLSVWLFAPPPFSGAVSAFHPHLHCRC
jgi:hypothetical protein